MKQGSVWLFVSAVSLAGIALMLFILALILRIGARVQARKEEWI